jgi:hypothetical protein
LNAEWTEAKCGTLKDGCSGSVFEDRCLVWRGS